MVAFQPRLLSAGILIVIAWLLATIVRRLFVQVATSAHLDERLTRSSGEQVSITRTLGDVAYYLIFLVFLPPILEALAIQIAGDGARKSLRVEMPYATSAGVALRSELAPQALFVEADATQLRRVLLNVINNAIEAMEGRSGEIVVKSAAADASGQVSVSVRDEGRGIPDLDAVLEPMAKAVERLRELLGPGLPAGRTGVLPDGFEFALQVPTGATAESRRDGLRRGIVTLCIGGGLGIALATVQ